MLQQSISCAGDGPGMVSYLFCIGDNVRPSQAELSARQQG
jgi:hypothetical protein